MSEKEIIAMVIEFISVQFGVDLVEDEYFTGLQEHQGKVFFNVELDVPCFDSMDFTKLQRVSGDGKALDRVISNGYKRLAIFFNIKEIRNMTYDLKKSDLLEQSK